MYGGHITLNGNLNQTINKSTFLLYKKIGEQYYDFQILEKIKSLIPEHIARLNEDDKIKSIMGWFKNDFMSWTPKDPICNRCMDKGRGNLPMHVRIVPGSSWKLRAMEIHRCDKCSYEYSFPRHGQILKIAEGRTADVANGRCFLVLS